MASVREKRRRLGGEGEGFVEVVRGGDLTRATEAVIAHQCNCTSRGARGLAKALFREFPKSDVYRTRRGESQPGTIDVCEVGKGRLTIVALFAQVSPGKPRLGRDSPTRRLEYFAECLDRLGAVLVSNGHSVVAMPYLIGCGLAGGSWASYHDAIQTFARTYRVTVRLYDIQAKAPHHHASLPRQLLPPPPRRPEPHKDDDDDRAEGGGGGVPPTTKPAATCQPPVVDLT